MVECSTGRACVTARWGISIGAADVAFQVACMTARPGTNPLSLCDQIAATFRELDIEIARELPE
jgi:hypothetical protein